MAWGGAAPQGVRDAADELVAMVMMMERAFVDPFAFQHVLFKEARMVSMSITGTAHCGGRPNCTPGGKGVSPGRPLLPAPSPSDAPRRQAASWQGAREWRGAHAR